MSDTEARVLQSAAAPIVLLRLRKKSAISKEVAPDNPYLGVMLPYTPLHALLMHELGFPIVATSGNLSNEPICIDNDEALKRLGDIADIFLVHDRPIERPIDDSVVQIVHDEIQVLRLARGYAPLSLELDESSPATLAVGAHLKSAICVSNERQIVLSQHIGDLETPQTFATFQRAIKDFQHLYEIQPDCIAHDLHPDYLSTQYAQDLDRIWNPVQHHVAHVLSGMIERHQRGCACRSMGWYRLW
jgi:hydrogenase maturation protein HypF